MSAEKGYQGWRNYETWAVKLWIDNEEGSHTYWRERALSAWEDAAETPPSFASRTQEDRARLDLSDVLKAEHEEALPELEGFAADLLNAAFGEVDWYEIAGELLDAVKEQEGA